MSVKQVNLDVARAMVDACYAKAKEMNLKVVMAVADSHGDVLVLNRMDGAFLVSNDLAASKAWTVVALKMPTSTFAELILPGQPLYGMENSNGHRLATLGGGIPILFEGEVIGGVGVSGATAEEDAIIAQAGIDCFQAMQ